MFLLDFMFSSIAAIVLILIGIIPQLYALNHSPNPIFNGDFCKIRGYMGQTSAMLCRWFLTIACIDRCLFTSTNARLRDFSTVRRARKMILIVTIIWLIIPIHMLIFTDVRRQGFIVCMMSTNTSAFYHTIYTIVTGGLTPPLIMMGCTKIIWKNLQLKRQRRETGNQHRRITRDIQVLIMLLTQVILFLIFTLPYMSFNLYLALTRSVTNKSAERLSIESFMQLFTEVTVFVYPSISFYSNTLSSHTFRNELMNLFIKIFPCIRHRNRVIPISGTGTTLKRNDIN